MKKKMALIRQKEPSVQLFRERLVYLMVIRNYNSPGLKLKTLSALAKHCHFTTTYGEKK